jgi:hypothetical protein
MAYETVGGLKTLSLTDAARQHGVPLVADPKIFYYRDALWITFNTGHYFRPNKIFIMQIAPEILAPTECHLQPRQTIEKNWAFFDYDGGLYAIYSIWPLRFVRCDAGDGREKKRRFSFVGDWPMRSPEMPAITLGSQPRWHGDRLELICHERFAVGRKRIYFARMARIELGRKPKVLIAGKRLFHSIQSLLGSRRKFNPNLFSCTYVSGLEICGAGRLLGYGVNDGFACFAEVPSADLW